uniref:ras-related and estrogen-regulated growth inhibitor-like protein isoform X2 n=1 Tax=Myxine glutinosa TaxID=7769 RepID=UPI00358E81C1
MSSAKVAILGSDGVGKSDLLYKKQIKVDGRHLNLEVFDPCSQLCHNRTELVEQVRWADAFVVVYDISDHVTFREAKSLISNLKKSCKSLTSQAIFLVGNKQDLCHAREVSEEDARFFAEETGALFCELSVAEHPEEVAIMFVQLLRTVQEVAKARERRRHSGSKSMTRLINVFGKRRQSV